MCAQQDGSGVGDGDIASEDLAYILRLPDELICAIAHFYNPSVPFMLGHFVLAGDYRRYGRDELRSLAATCKRFGRILRPTIYRNLVFQDKQRRSNTVHLYKAKSIHEHVRELYWQPSHLYNDMSPVFLPLLQNLTYLILAFLPQNVPDEFMQDDYVDLTTLRTSFTDALRQLPNLECLEIPFWEKCEDTTFRFDQVLPKLSSLSVGDWQEWEAFGDTSKITTVKWLLHPDLDLDETVISGFVENMMPHTTDLQFAAHSGWGRTDLPEKLPGVLKNAEWYKDVKDHPLATMTLHGFNPITSLKEEWRTLLPSYLSLLKMRSLRQLTFLDVPTVQNDGRMTLDWDGADKLEQVERVTISLATERDTANVGGGDNGRDGEDHQQEQNARGSKNGANEEHEELSERISPDEVYTLLSTFPNMRQLVLANFLRCEKPMEHSRGGDGDSGRDDPTDRFAEEHFQPAARDFVRELGLWDRFPQLEQIVFRSVEAELAVRFRRTKGGNDDGGEHGWAEELRRLY
ncbi:hypothetical protein JCM10213_004187 [Rhodosporidiobolus nylandii]